MTKRWLGIRGGLVSLVLVIAGCGGGGSGGTSGCLGESGAFSSRSVDAQSADISGVIQIESQTRVDSDTADDFRVNQAVSNDCDDQAQPLPVTGVSGGYLSPVSGDYPAGENDDFLFQFEADSQDYYTADLRPGDRVSLQVFSDPRTAAPEPRMQIFNQSETLVFDSENGAGSTPYLHVVDSAEGRYTVRVSASAGGPFRYVVIAADGSERSNLNTAYAEPAFVPGEAVVSVRSGNAFGSTSSTMASLLSAQSARKVRPDVWHLRRSDFRAMATVDHDRAMAETISWVNDLQGQPDISSASPNYLYQAQTVSPGSNPLYGLQWNYSLISLPIAWQAAPRAGNGVGVAVLDTGLFSTSPASIGGWHPDLQANVNLPNETLDFVSLPLDLDNEPGRDNNPADPGDGQLRSSNFHGTHVAGIVAAADNAIGVVGVANQSDLIPVRVLGEAGTGTLADLIAAIAWAGQSDDLDIINLSLGGLAYSEALEDVINDAHFAGKLVVAAAGNEGSDEETFPAAFENVFGVGAVDGGGVRASYSNVGPSVDLVAPGGDANRDANLDNRADLVISAWGSDDNGAFEPSYAGLQGTSMAAPHVSGIFALMKAENPGLDSEDFQAFLLAGELTDEVGSIFEYGRGLINSVKAVDAALGLSIPTVLGASPSILTFDLSDTQKQLALNIYPSGESTTVTAIETGEDWLVVGPELSVGEMPPASVTVGIQPDLLEQNNSFDTELKISYDSNGTTRTLNVPVNVRLVDANDARDAGRHYVLLVPADDGQRSSYQTVVSAIGGQYRFSFNNVEAGDYFLVAGSDVDNNGLICESGEACAEYPVNGLPQVLTIAEEPMNSLTLTTSFRRPTLSSLGGMPRIGFEGYRIMPEKTENSSREPVREYVR